MSLVILLKPALKPKCAFEELKLDLLGEQNLHVVVRGQQRNARLGYQRPCDTVVANVESDSCGRLGAKPQPC